MKQSVTSGELQNELRKVNEEFTNSFVIWQEEIERYVEKLSHDPLLDIIPAFVLGVYKYAGIDRDLSISMANIFKIIYLGTCIHEGVKDKEEGQECDQEMQFSILLGDYIFGKILKLLIQVEATELLDIFAELICQMSEGLTVKYKMKTDLLYELKNIYVPIFSAAFISAARLSGSDKKKEEAYRRLGCSLGFAVCLSISCDYTEYPPLVQFYIDESIRILSELEPENHISSNYIQRLLLEICSIDRSREKAVV
ncbi:hypothetical protein [Thermosyntropha sp.]|uniref:hypothetical protein n=1 Tax=Thermosyntropha sp. TaxID=2740820 RepID=UPI0025F3CB98|nr:hypothetical protein [Thermosyntropha sp.]MBO8159086.1 hypothetical protein [Thermosyntropha sp.]